MIGIVLADDEPVIRQGFATIDWASNGFELLGIGTNGSDTLELVRAAAPQIVLTDIRMPGMDGIQLMHIVKEERPATKFILLTAYHDFDYALSAIKLGATAFVLKPSDPDDIMAAFLKAKSQLEAERQRELAEKRMARQLRAFSLALRDKLLPDAGGIRGNETVAKAIALMEERYHEEITVVSVAEQVHLNPVYLSRLIKKETGETFSDILLRIRLDKASTLLKDMNVKIYEIAERVGFKDGRYFGQVFKKNFGMTPKEYRDKLLDRRRRGEHP